MNVAAILIAAALTIDPSTYYKPVGGSIPASAYYTPVPPKAVEPEPKKPALEEENDEPAPAVPEDPLRVVVYVDLADLAGLRKLLAECDRLPGLHVEYKDKDQVPEQGKAFKLPLAHYRTESGWVFLHWTGAEPFRKWWLQGNPSHHQEQAQIKPPAQSNRVAGYRAHSYEWHLTQGESAAAIRNHLAVPRSEHHGHSFPRWWLDRLSFTELVGAHSDAHNNRIRWEYVGTQPAASQSRNQAASVTVQSSGFFNFLRPKSRRSSGGCPDGQCPR